MGDLKEIVGPRDVTRFINAMDRFANAVDRGVNLIEKAMEWEDQLDKADKRNAELVDELDQYKDRFGELPPEEVITDGNDVEITVQSDLCSYCSNEIPYAAPRVIGENSNVYHLGCDLKAKAESNDHDIPVKTTRL